MCQRTKTTSAAVAAAVAPTILSILCPTGKRSSHCSEAAAVAAVSISFGSRVTTQLEKGSRRREGKRDRKEKGIPNSVRSGVPWVSGPNSKSRISQRRKSLPSVEKYSSRNCNQHVSGDNNSVRRRSGRRAYELPVMTCPPARRPSLPPFFPSSATNCHVPQFQSVASSVRKRRGIHTAVYLVDGGRRRTEGTVLTASPTTTTSHVNVSPSLRPYLTL